MKGISAVISVVLILMITVALASMAYVWFTTVFRTITTGTEEAAAGGLAAMATKFTIESAHNESATANVVVSIRNTGTKNIVMGTIAAYVNDASKPVSNPSIATLIPGNVSSFTVTITPVPCETGILKVTEATGYEAYATIKC